VVAAAFGDVDGDGDADALLNDLDSPSPLLLNNGNGVFSLDLGATLPRSGACGIGDLDGDGDSDLFFAGFLNPSQVWLNDGTGSFTDSGQLLGANEFRTSMLLLDVDNDGDLDAVLPTDSSTESNKILLNDGGGVFTDSGQVLGMNFSREVASGDLDGDGDGDPDLIFAVNGKNEVWLNDGLGVFTKSLAVNFSSSGTFGVGVADLDGDTDLDLFFANGSNPPSSPPDEVWLNNGSGVFTNSGQMLGADYSFNVALADIDGDSDMDALVGTNSGMPNRIYLNNGSGVFTEAGGSMGIGRVLKLGADDFDADGDQDVFLAANLDPAEVWLGVASAPFLEDSGQRLGANRVSGVAAGDLDGDGDLDAVLSSVAGTTRLFFNDGTGQMADQHSALSNGYGNNNGKPALGDFDDDGDLDLYIPNNEYAGSADVLDRLWLNDGTGEFTLGTTFTEVEPGNCSVAADFNGDGDLDLIVGNGMYSFYTGQNQLRLNNGSGGFVSSPALGTGNTTDFAVADFDGDSALDVFVANAGGGDTVWMNNGSAVFSDSGQSLGTAQTLACVAADFDGDGDVDVATTNYNASNVLWLNDGSGTFSAAILALGIGSAPAIGVIDAEGDGDLDLWIGQEDGDRLYINNGVGGFSKGQVLPDRSNGGLAMGDFTGDGIDDVLTGGTEGDHVLWVRDDLVGMTVMAYAASFGLVGGDTGATEDPDLDGLPNYAEMAYNLNPNDADAEPIANFFSSTSGLPLLSVLDNGTNRTIQAQIIRRKGAPFLDFALNTSPTLLGFSAPISTTVTTMSINANYERATYLYVVPGGQPKQFGEFEVDYNP